MRKRFLTLSLFVFLAAAAIVAVGFLSSGDAAADPPKQKLCEMGCAYRLQRCMAGCETKDPGTAPACRAKCGQEMASCVAGCRREVIP